MTTRDVEAVASAVARATWQTIQQQQAVQSTSGTSCRSEVSCHIDRCISLVPRHVEGELAGERVVSSPFTTNHIIMLSTTNEPVIVLAFLAVNVTAGLAPATCPRRTLNSLLL